MTLQPQRPYLEVLRDALRALEAEPGSATPEKSELLRQLRKRIAEIESTQRLTK
jgi:hypothetical protein